MKQTVWMMPLPLYSYLFGWKVEQWTEIHIFSYCWKPTVGCTSKRSVITRYSGRFLTMRFMYFRYDFINMEDACQSYCDNIKNFITQRPKVPSIYGYNFFVLYRHMMTSPNVWKIVKRADVKLRIYVFQVRFHCPIQFGSVWDLLVVIYSSW